MNRLIRDRTFIFLALAFGTGCSTTQVANIQELAATDRTVAWTGFAHKWGGANHRIQRMGSYIGDEQCVGAGCEYKAVHAAASGTDDDTAQYTMNLLKIRARNVVFKHHKVQLELVGKEEATVSATRNVEISLEDDPRFAEMRKFEVALAGFDLYSTEEAKKLGDFSLRVEPCDRVEQVPEGSFKGDPADRPPPVRIVCAKPGDKKLRATVKASFKGFCKSAECGGSNSDVRYTLDVHLLVIAGGEPDVYFAPQPSRSVSYSFEGIDTWTLYPERMRERELQRSDVPASLARVNLASPAGVPSGTRPAVLIKGLSIRTENTFPARSDKGLHLLEWNSQLTAAPDQGGSRGVTADLWYKSWRADKAMETYQRPGTASLTVTPLLVEFRDAEIRQCCRRGSVHWPGGDRSPLTSQSVSEGVEEADLSEDLSCDMEDSAPCSLQ